MKLFSFFLFFCFLSPMGNLKLLGNTSATPESTAIQNVRLVMEIFEKANGAAPTNWTQLEKFFSLKQINEQSLKGSSAYPLQQHYVFVSETIPMLGYQEGNVVLIRTEPFGDVEDDLVRKGRYIISDYDGVFLFHWYPEEKVQEMLAKAGVKELPKPEPMPQTTNAAQFTQPGLNVVEPAVPLTINPNDSSKVQSPEKRNPANEVVDLTPVSQGKSWWPVFLIVGIGLFFYLILWQRRKKQ